MNSIPADVRPAKIAHEFNAWDAALDDCRRTQDIAYATREPDARTAHSRAIDQLLVTPAPHRAALLTKIEFMASEYAEFAMEALMLSALAADGRRLLVEG
jgi:hypothetical protein